MQIWLCSIQIDFLFLCFLLSNKVSKVSSYSTVNPSLKLARSLPLQHVLYMQSVLVVLPRQATQCIETTQHVLFRMQPGKITVLASSMGTTASNQLLIENRSPLNCLPNRTVGIPGILFLCSEQVKRALTIRSVYTDSAVNQLIGIIRQ